MACISCCALVLRISFWLLLSVVVNAKIEITPIAPVILKGSNISLYCSIPGQSQHTAQDIQWYHRRVGLAKNAISLINTTVSTLSLTNVTFSDWGPYICCISDDCNNTQVYVGVPPGPIQDFRCISRNVVDYWCEWRPGAQTYLEVDYQFSFKKRRRHNWEKCPDNWSKGDHSCYVDYTRNHVTQQIMKVVSTNALGHHEDIIQFNPSTQTIPNVPRDVDVTVAAESPSNRLQVTWAIPDEWSTNLLDPFGDTLTYKIRYRLKQSANWTQYETRSSERRFVLLDLLPFSEYCIQVAAANSVAENNVDYWSDWSDAKCALTDEGAPSGTININIDRTYDRPGNKRDVYLQWNDMALEHRNGIILGYVLYVRKADDIVAVPQVYNTSLKGLSLQGLDKFAEYVVYIHGFNSAGAGPNSTCKIPDLTDNPGPPLDVRAVAMTASTILVKWKEPSDANGHLQFYCIQWQKHDETEDRLWENAMETTIRAHNTYYMITGLDTYTVYDIRVQAHNIRHDRNLTGIFQTIDLIRTLEGVLEKPPQSVNVAPVLDRPTKLHVSWELPTGDYNNGKVLGYLIYRCSVQTSYQSGYNCTGATFVKNLTSASQRFAIIDDLRPFTSYLIWMAAYSRLGPGAKSKPVEATTSEGESKAPLNLTITSFSATSISLSWSPPVETNGILQEYIVWYSGSNLHRETKLIDGNRTSCTLSGLREYHIYTMWIQACTSLCGPFSQTVAVKTYIGVPGKPKLHEPELLAVDKMRLRWDPPDEQSNRPIDHIYYIIMYRPTNTTKWSVRETTSTTLLIEVTCGLESDGVMYDMQVAAVNINETRHKMRGSPSMMKQHEMCQRIPVNKTLVVVISVGVLVAGVILVVMFYQVKKADVFQDHLPAKPEFVDSKLFKALENGIPCGVIEKEVFDEPLTTKQCMINSTESTECAEATMDTKPLVNAGHLIPPWGSLEQIKTDRSVKLLFTRSDSTDSGVPPSPCNYSNNHMGGLMVGEDSLSAILPSFADDFIKGHFIFDSGEDNKVKSNSAQMENSGSLTYCNKEYMRESSAPFSITDTAQDEGNSNSVIPSTITGSMSMFPSLNLKPGVTSHHHTGGGDISDTSTDAGEHLVASSTQIPDSPDGSESVPYFQVGMSYVLSPVVKSHMKPPGLSDMKQIGDDHRIVEHSSDFYKKSNGQSLTYVMLPDIFSKNHGEDEIIDETLAEMSSEAVPIDENMGSSSSKMADFVANQLTHIHQSVDEIGAEKTVEQKNSTAHNLRMTESHATPSAGCSVTMGASERTEVTSVQDTDLNTSPCNEQDPVLCASHVSDLMESLQPVQESNVIEDGSRPSIVPIHPCTGYVLY
ncbi:uncharacterized protein [Amphiura filiformis]|uniref:uncharacterized protein n=1 Tax=Amphiura filiformis TaxID=82378 RepID=UPI003B21BF62